MSRLILIATMILSSFVVSTVSAADTGTTTTAMDAPPMTTTDTDMMTDTPLLLSTVTVTDATTISLAFNQAIQIDSVRVRIIDQATNENIKVATITGALDPMIATIVTSTPLTPGASYVITITSALSTDEMTIKAGIDSIREFTVPLTVKGATLNAPSNPTAVIVATGTATTPQPTTPTVATGATVNPQDTEALPATGTPTTLLIALAALSALALLLVRKRA